MNLLIVDIGTSSMRGSLFSEQGIKKCTAQVKYKPINLGNGEVEQEVHDWEKALLQIIKDINNELSPNHGAIHAIALTSQRSSVIPVNKEGEPLMNAIMWQDSRNKDICEELSAYNGLIFRKSGAKVNTVFSGSKMKWIKDNRPDIYANINKFVNIPEYLIHLMTGEYVTDYTYGSRSNLMNLYTHDWDHELLEVFEIKREQLCRLIEPGSIAGYVNAKFAFLSGLKEKIPVISAGGDQQCAMIGMGAYEVGSISIVAGTGAFLEVSCSEVPEGLMPDIICNVSAIPGKYILETNILTCCSAFNWFYHNFYEEEQYNYERINRELEEVYGIKNDCIVLPFFQGRSTPDWNAKAKGTISGITLATKRQDILKGILEGVCMEINNNIQLLKKYAPIKKAYISGGLTKSGIFNRMQADIYGMPLSRMENCEATTLGALMTAYCSLHITDSLEEAFTLIHKDNKGEVIETNPDKHNEFEIKRLKMNQLYHKIYS